MGTPGAVLKEFWQEIQAKARIRIDRTDLRPELLDFAADMVGTLWERAVADADAGLDLERSQIRADRAQAEAEVLQAREEALRKQAEVVRVETQLGDARAEIRMMESRLAAALEGRKNLEQEVSALREEIRLRDEALDRARTDFATELAASREQAQQAAARYEEASRRSMLEIDRARTASAALQRTLDELRQRSAETEAGLREEVDRVRRDVSRERHRVGVLEGELALRVLNESRSGSARRRASGSLDLPALLPSSRRRLRRTALRRSLPRRA
jgi:chromosome segregation ATPase